MRLLIIGFCMLVAILLLIFMYMKMRRRNRVDKFLDLDEVKEESNLYQSLGILTSDKESPTMLDVDTLRYTEVRDMIEAMSPGLYYIRNQMPKCYQALKNIVFINK